MAKAPQTYESDLEATISTCLDCGAENAADDTECIECDSDALEYLHVTTEPLGYDDDEDYRVHANADRGIPQDLWKYQAQQPAL
jgi:hypothetical protein